MQHYMYIVVYIMCAIMDMSSGSPKNVKIYVIHLWWSFHLWYLSLQMNRESQMWPSFSVPAKTTTERHRSPHNNHNTTDKGNESLPYEEEMSGMFTLKRKKDKGSGAGDISRSSSVSSHSQRSSSSSGGGHRRRSQSTDPGLSNRTSRTSAQNHYWENCQHGRLLIYSTV